MQGKSKRKQIAIYNFERLFIGNTERKTDILPFYPRVMVRKRRWLPFLDESAYIRSEVDLLPNFLIDFSFLSQSNLQLTRSHNAKISARKKCLVQERNSTTTR